MTGWKEAEREGTANGDAARRDIAGVRILHQLTSAKSGESLSQLITYRMDERLRVPWPRGWRDTRCGVAQEDCSLPGSGLHPE